MTKDGIEYRFPWISVVLMAGIFIFVVLAEKFNWSPFW